MDGHRGHIPCVQDRQGREPPTCLFTPSLVFYFVEVQDTRTRIVLICTTRLSAPPSCTPTGPSYSYRGLSYFPSD